MSAASTIGAYAAALVLVFAAALGVGRAVGPVGTPAPEPMAPEHTTQQTDSTHTSGDDGHSGGGG